MKPLRNCTVGGMGLALLVSLGLGSWAYGQCNNDVGAGDLDEAEVCQVDNSDDTTNYGCNDLPGLFTELTTGDFDGGQVVVCGKGSTFLSNASCETPDDCDPGEDCVDGECIGGDEPSVSSRDTDWYLIPQSVLNDMDTDGNGVVEINAQHLLAELDLLIYLIDLDRDPGGQPCDVDDDCPSGTCVGDPNPGDGNPEGTCEEQCDASVFSSPHGCLALGGQDCTTNDDCHSGECSAGTCTFTEQIKSEVLIIADHPDGVAVWTSTGFCSGAGNWGDPQYFCSTGANDYLLRIFFEEPFENCTPGPPQGPCNEANPDGRPGCEDPSCCQLVCEQPGLALCCIVEWDGGCAQAAVDLGCAPDVGSPVFMATGPDEDQAVDGYLRVKADPFGAFATESFGGTAGGGDLYNPVGAPDVQETAFSDGFLFFIPAANQRQILANNPNWQDSIAGTDDDGGITRAITQVNLESDDSGDGVTDRLNSQFTLTGPGVDLVFDVEQKVDNCEGAVATLTQTMTITNNLASEITFILNRQFDGDFLWVGDATDDSTGTGTNGSPADMFVFMQEAGDPTTAVTLSSPSGTAYCGAKQPVIPDEGDPDCPAYDYGSDTEEWSAFGLPDCWRNHIAYVGYNLNGTSGNPAAGDVHTVIETTITIGATSSVEYEFLHTYGQQFPCGQGGAPCPWDCQTTPNGQVDIPDFLAILAQWGQEGTSCDFGSGDPGVGINEFLDFLANFGPCP